jgi:hypothetical protein
VEHMAFSEENRRIACERKVSFVSYDKAAEAANKLMRKGQGQMNVYSCSICWGWHVGHQPEDVSEHGPGYREPDAPKTPRFS